jgi:lipopolysaccharide transport system ATP-binding protein
MSDVAGGGRTVLFVSHNMSAVLRLTSECIILEHGKMVKRAPSQEAVDYYLSNDYEQGGERRWKSEEMPESKQFRPISLKVMNQQRVVTDSLRSVEPNIVEFEYTVDSPIQGLRVGIYIATTRGEFVFTSFDTDEVTRFDQHLERKSGHYISRCTIPANLLNEGRYVIGVNASVFRVKSYFTDQNAVIINVNPSGAPGMQWGESRQGVIRPDLEWEIIRK